MSLRIFECPSQKDIKRRCNFHRVKILFKLHASPIYNIFRFRITNLQCNNKIAEALPFANNKNEKVTTDRDARHTYPK